MRKRRYNQSKRLRKKENSKPDKNIYEKYIDLPAKGDVQNTLIKSVVDTAAGSIVGTGIGALAGDKAAFAGILMILAGHYIGDESGLLRVTGASTMAYGIGKAKEYQNNPDLATPSQRLGELKSDWLTAFHLKWKQQTQEKDLASSSKNEQPYTSDNNPIEGSKNELKEETLSSSPSKESTSDPDEELDKLFGEDISNI